MTARHYKVLLATLAMLVAGIAAVAQSPMHHGGFGAQHHMLGFLTKQLDLTEAQQAQVKDIFSKEKPTMASLMTQNGKIHQQLMQEAISGTFDQAKVQALAAQQGQIAAAMAVEHARIASQIYNILTPDQRTKAQQLLQQHMERMQQHMQKHGQAPAPEQ